MHNRVGAAAAIDRLNFPAKQDTSIRPALRGSTPIPLVGLRGILAPGTVDADGLLTGSAAFDGQPAGSRTGNRPMPYVRFGEGEQVYGFSFKIQPPPPAPDSSSGG